MNRKDELSDKLLDCELSTTNSNILIEEVQTMIQSERKRQAKWHRLTVICLIALGCCAIVMIGVALLKPARSLHTANGIPKDSTATEPRENPGAAEGELAVDNDPVSSQGAREFQFGFVDTFVLPLIAVGIPFVVLAALVLILMRWAATRSVGNAVIQKQLLELAQQVEQLQEGTKR